MYSQTLDRRRAAAAAANDVVSPMNTAHSSGVLTLSPKTPSVLDPYDLIYLLKWCVSTMTNVNGQKHRSHKRPRLGIGTTLLSVYSPPSDIHATDDGTSRHQALYDRITMPVYDILTNLVPFFNGNLIRRDSVTAVVRALAQKWSSMHTENVAVNHIASLSLRAHYS